MTARTSVAAVAVALSACALAAAQQPLITAPDDWQKERIELPPSFAPDMKWRGVEELRFAPGMFAADSNSFFSYAFVLQIAGETPDQKQLKSELLKYYRGLAKAVGGEAVKGDAVHWKQWKQVQNGPEEQQTGRYEAQLQWIEPFVTKKAQTLRMKIETAAEADGQHARVIVQASPAGESAEIWRQLARVAGTVKR